MKNISPYAIRTESGVSRNLVAYYRDADGMLAAVGANQARPAYSETGEWEGLIIEDAATQLLAEPENFADAEWTKANITTNPGASDPLGTDRGFTLEGTDAASTLSVTGIAAGTYCLSIFARATSVGVFDLFWDSESVTFDLNSQSSSGGVIERYGDMFRCSVVYTAAVTHEAGLSMGVGFLDVFGANLTANELSSYIDAATTRPADELTALTAPRLVYSNIAEPSSEDDATPWAAGTYSTGDRVIFQRQLYASAIDSNTDRPDTGAAKEPQTWVAISDSNRWKMFDLLRGVDVQSAREERIDVIVQYPDLVDAISLHGMFGDTLKIEMFYNDGVVFSDSASLISDSKISTFYDWFYRPRGRISQYATFELPPIAGALIRVSITQPNGSALLGKLIAGLSNDIGVTLENVRGQLLDLSRTRRNEFGNIELLPGRQISQKTLGVMVESYRVAEIENVMKNLSGMPTVWVGEEDFEFTILYGRVVDFNEGLSCGEMSDCSIKIEEL